MHLFVILFFNLLQTTQYLAIYCNILQYAIYRYSLLAILYCIAVVNVTGFWKTDHIVTIDIARNTDLKY